MVSDLVFYPLVVVALAWLWIMLHYAWSSARSVAYHRRAKPITPPRQRSRDPRPFAGLTHKPPCAACEQASQAPVVSPPPAAPPRLTSTRGRRRHVDTLRHFCPNATCDYRGWAGLDNIRANGHPSGGLWRQLHCRACEGYFLETHGTLFHGTRVAPELLVWTIGALAEGLGIRAVARVFAVDPNTVLGWLVEAADHLQAFSRHFLHDVHVNQVQMDERFALLSAVKADEVSEAEAIQRLSRAPHWVWVALDPVSKLLLTIDVGHRTLAMAQRVVVYLQPASNSSRLKTR